MLNNGQKISYALGQVVGKYKGFDRINHGGGDAGYRTFLVRFPKERLSVVVFSNDGSFSSGTMAYKVADIYLDKKEEKSPATTPKPANAETKVFPVPAATLDAYSGAWEIQPGVVVTIARSGGELRGRLGNQSFRIVPVSLTKFKVEGANVELEFLKGDNGKYDKMAWTQGTSKATANRVKPFKPGKEELAEYTGKFYSDELETAYTFKVKDGNLVAEHSRHPDFELRPAKKDQFIGNRWFFGRTEYVRDSAGKIASIKVSSGRVRNLVFRKISSTP